MLTAGCDQPEAAMEPVRSTARLQLPVFRCTSRTIMRALCVEQFLGFRSGQPQRIETGDYAGWSHSLAHAGLVPDLAGFHDPGPGNTRFYAIAGWSGCWDLWPDPGHFPTA